MTFNLKEWGRAKVMLKEFRKRYPSVFGRDTVPLKVGIDADIIADTGLPEYDVKRALSYHVTNRNYFKACTKRGAMRHDLSGVPVDPVTPTEAAYAADPYGHKSNASVPIRPLPAQGHT